MNQTFINLRNKYPSIIYKNYFIKENKNSLEIEFDFEIPSLTTFNPKLIISKEFITNNSINDKFLRLIVFNIGMIELISYYKCVCPKKIIIEAGYLDFNQQKWFKKLYYYGLGEFLYVNNIDISIDELFDFEIKGEKIEIDKFLYNGDGNLIPVGGGKDSVVTLELLKNYKNNMGFIINPKHPALYCCRISSISTCLVERIIDSKLLDLNKKGFLNGHTPFSAIVAFVSYLAAYLNNKKYIVLSNESSANESTVFGSFVNHQYSKSLEFETDFRNYINNYFKIDIEYFSLLRPINEIQIAMLFSKYKKYHVVFKSCNLGSKEKEWNWCCKCPKCLFVYIILSTFMSHEDLIKIFGTDLLNDITLKEIFLELIGEKETKPFECVGTISEVIFSLNEFIKKNKDLPNLVKLYKEHFQKDSKIDLRKVESNNFVPYDYLITLKNEVKKVYAIIENN